MRRHGADRHLGLTAALAAGVIGALACGAAGQQDAAAGGKNEDQEAPLLMGPEVEDTHAPGSDTRFSPGMQADRAMERPVPLRVYEDALRALGGEEAPDEVRLREAQVKQIRAIFAAHRESVRAYFREHREELLRLREEAGIGSTYGRRSGDDMQRERDRPARRQPPASRRDQDQTDVPERPASGPEQAPEAGDDDAVMDDASARQAARRKLAELRAKGPSQDVVIKRVWDVLDEAQRAHVEAHIEAHREEMMRRREMRRAAERTGAERDNDTDIDLERLPPRVRERLESMTPEQRERALQRLRARREAARDRGREPARPKPAPSMDGVELPDPEG